MPGVSVFIDANVPLYARDTTTEPKVLAAAGWLRLLADLGCGRTNLQVLNEVTNVLLRKQRNRSAAEIFAEVDGLRFFGDAPLSHTTVAVARQLHLRSRYSWWDCLLLASALELGCGYFLSEDLQDGQLVESNGKRLTIIDPFDHSPDHILA
jgi:predicted nucleic acid-binding protein